MDTTYPTIALIGKPNAGKSTLFNALLRQRVAITNDMAGVTRDSIDRIWHISDGFTVLLTDTGGIGSINNPIHSYVQARSLEIMQKATLVLFVVEVHNRTAEDEQIIDYIRPFIEKTILVLNKADSEKRMMHQYEWCDIGFSDMHCVSATHSQGLAELTEYITTRLTLFGYTADEAYSAEEINDAEIRDSVDDDNELSIIPASHITQENVYKTYEKDEPLVISIVGQPNTGKSTLVNMLLGEDKALVTPIAGTTRDVVHGDFVHKGQKIHIVDTAGIRRRRRVHENIEYYSVQRALETIEPSDVILLMIDCQKGLVEQDKKIAHMAIKYGKPIILVLNKWDLLETVPNQFEAFCDRIRFVFPVLSFAPIFAISAQTGYNIEVLLKKCHVLKRQAYMRIDTAKLNSALKEWQLQKPLPSGKRYWKLRYMTQVEVAPVRFIAFVTRVNSFPQWYVRYLMNQIRKKFLFSDIPIVIELRDSSDT